MEWLVTPIRQSPLTALTLLFVLWKFCIGIITIASPGIGYDTSTSLFSATEAFSETVVPDYLPAVFKFVRWDAIYFTSLAQRGHVFEQQWAFGKGLSSILSAFAAGSQRLGSIAESGVLLSHLMHFGSVILLYDLAATLASHSHAGVQPMVAASLHILTPGGVFLSSPNAESTFSFLNMLGFWFYTKAKTSPREPGFAAMSTLSSGLSFAAASAVRSNGVLSGLPFLIDAVSDLLDIIQSRSIAGAFVKSQRLLVTVIAGLCIAAGLLVPQVVAYHEYCYERANRRPWCDSRVPLIFPFVQSHYWGNGFLRYWTMSNLPLFLLATPCMYLLVRSGIAGSAGLQRRHNLVGRLALPQLVLAVSILLNNHVQIITRLSSGYAWWYIWLSTRLGEDKVGRQAVVFMVMYALIQAGLYASFLPPA